MEIEKKLTKKCKFADLSTGDVFIYRDEVYMVIEEDYGLGNDFAYYGYAVLLETGEVCSFESDEECLKVTAKLTVTN